jgi:hypothetical protein
MRPTVVDVDDAGLKMTSRQSRQNLPAWHKKVINFTTELLRGEEESARTLSSEQLHHVFSLITRLIQLPVSSGKKICYFL